MKNLLGASALAICLLAPAVVSAASISGIVLYAADDFGNPNGFRTLEGDLQAQLWRTALGGEWHILGVWAGLPPQSLSVAPLNGPNFMVEIPLTDGENDFTLLGQPGSNTRNDEYERYAINLYFDGIVDRPGISVLFPKLNTPTGSPTSPNRSDKIYSLALNPVNVVPPPTTYDDGVVSVSVTAVSFLAPETYGLDVDLVSAQRLAPSGANDPEGSDYIGVLKVTVEASLNLGQPILGTGAAGGGGLADGIADGGAGARHGGVPIGGGMPRLIGEPRLAEDGGVPVGDARDVATTAEKAQPVAVAARTTTPEETTTPEVTPTAVTTPSPNASAKGGSPTPSALTTRTLAPTGSPVASGTPATPTPGAATTAVAATPTAAASK
jgi:hypothetical protein